MSPNLLSLKGVQKSFGGVHALRNVTLDLAPGQVLGLIGPNGAGKTTIFNVINGMYRCEGGEILLGGHDISQMNVPEIARLGTGRTFQVPRVFPTLTIEENLLAATARLRLGSTEEKHRIREALTSVDLGAQANKLASELSGGEKQLLQFARATIQQPKLLLLDEPFGGASAGVISVLIDAIRELAAEGVGCLVISHDIVSLPRLCEEVVVLVDGAVLTMGTLESVRLDPQVIQAYLGQERNPT